ncbi:ADP-heptose--lipooligosaccharide heptosyltransferase II [hydrothermal vent metagenome]|uniref:ADP-heptose--lipooligosaccharide heptosyltransferase II n=1 Tax=hydrothermal vent metagenome TaxID=652676 RepID=A0A1W1CLI2_9ZZZZ
MMLPAFELLKTEYPNAEFTVICKEYSRDIFRGKGISQIIIDDTKGIDRLKKTLILVKNIREKHYDLGVLFHNTFIDALIFKLANIDTIIGYDKENRKILLDFWLKIDKSRHYINHYANLVNSYLGDKYIKLPAMRLSYKKSNIVYKREERPLVGFVLGGENKGSRHYPKELSMKLMEFLSEKELDIVLLGDSNDSKNNNIYEKELIKNGTYVINISGKTTVAEFIDIIATLDILVTIDTSALHIASATNTKFLALIGKGTSPLDTVYPKVKFGRKLFRGEEMIKDKDLIYQIEPKEIIENLEEMLG